jgi:hypothetical protein
VPRWNHPNPVTDEVCRVGIPRLVQAVVDGIFNVESNLAFQACGACRKL